MAESPSVVVLAEIRDTINPATADYLKSALKRGAELKAAAVLVELDTPGGLVSSVKSMAQDIDLSPVPVVVYTAPAGASATSAGALLMFVAHVSAMAPGTHIGAAHPVGSDGKEVEGAAGEKAVNDTAAFARGLAEVRGRNVALAEEVVSKSRSFTAPEALKEKLVDLLANDRAALLKALDGRKVKTHSGERVLRTAGADVRPEAMSTGQKLMSWLAHPNVAAILMTLAMLLIYVEASHPGITVAGVMGVACLLVAFMAFQVLPIRTGGAAFLGLGMVLLVLEPFILSGGWLAAAGVISFVLGLLWFVDPSETNLMVSMGVLVPLALGLTFFAVVLTVATQRIRRLSRDILAKIGGAGAMGLEGYEGQVDSVEAGGLKGKARFRGEIWEFDAAQPVAAGQAVRARSVKGFTVRVEPVQSKSPGSKPGN
ncbi:MAG: nodulation protein NfeD [Bdellovibrionales bacterium]|nr:nodulation protein NfeD [Bdellovibrionales bacterium]